MSQRLTKEHENTTHPCTPPRRGIKKVPSKGVEESPLSGGDRGVGSSPPDGEGSLLVPSPLGERARVRGIFRLNDGIINYQTAL